MLILRFLVSYVSQDFEAARAKALKVGAKKFFVKVGSYCLSASIHRLTSRQDLKRERTVVAASNRLLVAVVAVDGADPDLRPLEVSSKPVSRHQPTGYVALFFHDTMQLNVCCFTALDIDGFFGAPERRVD